MKFAIFVLIVCALTINAQASVVPLALSSPLLYSAAYGPGITIPNSQPILVHAPSAIPAATHLYRAPLIVPVGPNAEATYVAKTAGSEHISSLPGHFLSASSINLEQAPATNKAEIKDLSPLLRSVAIHGSAIPAGFPVTYSQFIIPAPIVLPTEAKYVAKNLGVQHIAPLPGHSISTTSLNLEPAPGSKIENLNYITKYGPVKQ